MTKEELEVITKGLDSLNALISKLMERYNDYPVVPPSVMEFTEMYLDKLYNIIHG